ncbi:hypothetical protein MRX96_052383 [Rhipicephalus microplus]
MTGRESVLRDKRRGGLVPYRDASETQKTKRGEATSATRLETRVPPPPTSFLAGLRDGCRSQATPGLAPPPTTMQLGISRASPVPSKSVQRRGSCATADGSDAGAPRCQATDLDASPGPRLDERDTDGLRLADLDLE